MTDETRAHPQAPDIAGATAGDTDDVTEAAIEQGMASAAARSDGDAVSDLGARPAGEAEAARERDLASIEPGWPVFASDGALMGPAGRTGQDAFTIAGGSRQDRDMVIPREYIESVASERVVLNRPRSLLLDMQLDQAPIPPALTLPQHESGATQPARLDRELPVPPPSGISEHGAESELDSLQESGIGRERVDPTLGAAIAPTPSSRPQRSTPMDSAAAREVEAATTVENLGSPNTIPTTTGLAASEESGNARAGGPPTGTTPYLLDSRSRDESDGPTHQPSVRPDLQPLRGQPTEYAPFESPQEHNETDTDLRLNREPAPPSSRYWPPGSEPWAPKGSSEKLTE